MQARTPWVREVRRPTWCLAYTPLVHLPPWCVYPLGACIPAGRSNFGGSPRTNRPTKDSPVVAARQHRFCGCSAGPSCSFLFPTHPALGWHCPCNACSPRSGFSHCVLAGQLHCRLALLFLMQGHMSFRKEMHQHLCMTNVCTLGVVIHSAMVSMILISTAGWQSSGVFRVAVFRAALLASRIPRSKVQKL